VRPTASYLVCATPRSGSTLLCHLLEETGVAGRPEEYFEALRHSGRPRRPHEYFDRRRVPDIVRRLAFREMPAGDEPPPSELWRPETYGRYLAWAIERGTTPNGVFGAKLMWGYLFDFVELVHGVEGFQGLPVPRLLEQAFPGLRYVRVTRDDKVRQAVSLWKAVQTQAWRRRRENTDAEPAAAPAFSFMAIHDLVNQLHAHDAAWTGYFTGLGIEPLSVSYEDLAADNARTVAAVLDYLGIEAPPGALAAQPQLEQQADAVSEEWVRRYEAMGSDA
jgi:LPS sulfotransferase NodH